MATQLSVRGLRLYPILHILNISKISYYVLVIYVTGLLNSLVSIKSAALCCVDYLYRFPTMRQQSQKFLAVAASCIWG